MRRKFTRLENDFYTKTSKNAFQQTKFRVYKILKWNFHSGFKACGDPPGPAKVTSHGTQQQKHLINIYDEQ
jgi:hypothetical protein